MNKMYKCIFNHATQSWVAVSEATNAKGKKASGGLVMGSLLAMGLLASPMVLAEQGVSGGSAIPAQSTAISACTGSQAIGGQAVAGGKKSIAIGCDSDSLGRDGVAIGDSTYISATVTQGVALGYSQVQKLL